VILEKPAVIRKIILVAILTVATVTSVFADQAAYISKAQAEKAAAFLKDKKQIRHYCSPCSEKGDRVEDIGKVEAAAVKDNSEGWWEVKVNGEGIDLAYIYFRTKNGKWKNLAKELDIKVDRVPKYLPDN